MNPSDLTGILLDCLHPDPTRIDAARLKMLGDEEWKGLVEQARGQGVGPLLYHRIMTADLKEVVPPKVLTGLKRIYIANAGRTLLLQKGLRDIIQALHAWRIPVIVLKGSHLAHTAYENPALRQMVDIDLLVPQERMQQGAETLVQLGYRPSAPFSVKAALAVTKHLPRFVKPGSIGVEIHGHLINPGSARCIDHDGVWERAVAITIAGQEVLGLSPEDLLLHLCSHIAIDHGFNRNLSHLYDIRQTIEFYRDKIDWPVVWDRSRTWGVDRSLYLVFSLADKLLGLNLPEGFLQTLEPGRPDFDALALSEKLLFSSGSRIPPPLARLWGEYTMIEKARHLLKRIFPAKEEMACMYPASKSSLKIYLYYPLRIKDLMTRHFASVKRVLNRDEETLSALRVENQRNKLIDWLLSN